MALLRMLAASETLLFRCWLQSWLTAAWAQSVSSFGLWYEIWVPHGRARCGEGRLRRGVILVADLFGEDKAICRGGKAVQAGLFGGDVVGASLEFVGVDAE